MKKARFDEIVQERIAHTCETLLAKGREYGSDKDRLSNFKRAAAIRKCTPEEALVGMWTKQLVSVLDMVDAITIGTVIPANDRPIWAEKIGDAVNYLILLEALVIERMEDGINASLCKE